MKRMGKRPRMGVQALLLRIALVSLPVILALSLLATVAAAATSREAFSLTIKYHGKTTRTTANAGTVGELLTRLGLTLSGEDVVSHGMEDCLEADMVITIDHVVTAREVYTAALPKTVSFCWDPSIPEGMEAVLVEGEDGELACTADVTYVNGLEVSRRVLCQDLLRPMVQTLIAKGTGQPEGEAPKPEKPVIGEGYITLPTGEVLTYKSVRTITASAYSHMDKGCDSITATGTRVHWGTVAVDPSVIPYGTRMFIQSSDGEFVYGIAQAEDFGGSTGPGRIDLYMPTYHECIQFGRRECTVYFLG